MDRDDSSGLTIREMFSEVRRDIKALTEALHQHQRDSDVDVQKQVELSRRVEGHSKSLYGEKGDNGLIGDVNSIKTKIATIGIILSVIVGPITYIFIERIMG